MIDNGRVPFFDLGRIHLPHFMDDSSVNFHDKVFHYFCKFSEKNEEKPCHIKYLMDDLSVNFYDKVSLHF